MPRYVPNQSTLDRADDRFIKLVKFITEYGEGGVFFTDGVLYAGGQSKRLELGDLVVRTDS